MPKALQPASRKTRVAPRAARRRSPRGPLPLVKLYSLEDADEVTTFIAQAPYLVPLLIEAATQLRRPFPDAKLKLQVRHDPDAPAHGELVLAVVTNLSATAALEQLDQFDTQWWLANASRAQGQLCVTLAFA